MSLLTVQKDLRDRVNHEKRVKANRRRAEEFNRAVRVANWRIKVDRIRP